MKIQSALLFTIYALSSVNVADAAEALFCTTTQSFTSTCVSGQYCCPNNNYKVIRSCPDGWQLSGSTCSRASTTGSDENGDYTVEYTSCDAIEERQTCCDIKTNLSAIESAKCLSCVGAIL